MRLGFDDEDVFRDCSVGLGGRSAQKCGRDGCNRRGHSFQDKGGFRSRFSSASSQQCQSAESYDTKCRRLGDAHSAAETSGAGVIAVDHVCEAVVVRSASALKG